jgi:hypothetical protein
MTRRTAWVLALGFVAGALGGHTTAVQTSAGVAQERVLVEGHGRANTSLRVPGEEFTFKFGGDAGPSFRIVPRGKLLILTDLMYVAQGSLKEDVVVNVSSRYAGRPPSILLQTSVAPRQSRDVHLCYGYVIPEGHSVVSYTGASTAPGQFVSLAVTGYLVDAR